MVRDYSVLHLCKRKKEQFCLLHVQGGCISFRYWHEYAGMERRGMVFVVRYLTIRGTRPGKNVCYM